jgi:acetyl-CoA carboxylase biotin carboxyl carrier protein
LSEKKPTKKTQSGGESTGESGPMDLALLQRLVKLMEANDLNMVELRDGDKRVILRRGAAPMEGSLILPQATAAATAGKSAKSSDEKPATPEDENAGLHAIKSPMVGTFYAAPSPDAKAFVNVGSSVDEESDVCVIEAMKVFNNVKAECRGTIAKILVSNGQAVEFGQTLFLVKP